MPLLILGVFFVIGLIIYYFFSDSSVEFDNDEMGIREDEPSPFEKEENVIFLPNDIESVKEMYKKKK